MRPYNARSEAHTHTDRQTDIYIYADDTVGLYVAMYSTPQAEIIHSDNESKA